jgi:pimeloyl-ACP methyl ester carboxylesterase
MNLAFHPKSANLLLLPGLICNEFVWHAQVSGIAGTNVATVPGYGDARSLTVMAQRVLNAAPATFALAGHSMGARVALELYRLAPERVERLALLDTGVHPEQPGERDKRMALVELGRRQGMAALVESWLPPMVHPDRRDELSLMAPLREMCISAGIEQFENQVTALLERPDARPMLAFINCPTLVAVGRQDTWSPVQQHEAIAAAIPGAELVIFEDSGHMAPVEVPNQVNRALKAWLAR